jgi:hypothetical protein
MYRRHTARRLTAASPPSQKALRGDCSHERFPMWRVGPTEETVMLDDKSQGIVRDNRGEEQPADKDRAQKVNSVEEKKKTEDDVQKTAEKSGF